jgi:hypothetical protein
MDTDIEVQVFHPIKSDDKKIKVIPKRLPQPVFRMLLVGYSGSGKSNLIKNILFNTKWGYNAYFDNIIVICGSADDVSEYRRLAKKTKVPMWWEEKEKFYKSKKEDLIDKMVITQSATETDLKEIVMELEENNDDENSTLIVLDDMIVDVLFRNKVRPNVIDELYVRGRHLGKGVSIVISTQRYLMISQNIRFTNGTQLVLYNGLSPMDIATIATETGYEYEELLALIEKLIPEKFMFFVLNLKASREKMIQDGNFKYVRLMKPEENMV